MVNQFNSMRKPDLSVLNQHDKPYISVLVTLLLIIYSLYWIIPFGASDDYFRNWSYITDPEGFLIQQLKSSMMDGRVINGIFLGLFFRPDNISELGYSRLLNLGLFIIFSILLFIFLRKKFDSLQSLLICLIICTLPPFLMIFFFASLIGAFIAAIFAGIAVLLISDFHSINDFRGDKIAKIMLTGLLLTGATHTYQPLAMLYWVFVAILLISEEQKNKIAPFLRKYIIYLVVFMLSMGLSLLLIRAAPMITGWPNNPRTTLLSLGSLSEKLIWFFQFPLSGSINFLLLPEIPISITVIVIFFVSVGLYLWFEGSFIYRFTKMLLTLSFLPLAYFPNLVIQENSASFRTMVGLSSMWVILIAFCMVGYRNFFRNLNSSISISGRVGLITWAFFAIIFAIYHSAVYLIIPAFFEHRIINYRINELPLKVGDTIFVLMPSYQESLSPFVHWGEFGFPASATTWGGRTLTQLVLRENGFQPKQIKVATIEFQDEAPVDSLGNHILNLKVMKKFQTLQIFYPIEKLKLLISLCINHLSP